MCRKTFRIAHGLKEIILDNFAGGGGASTGIETATGYSVYAAINHDPDAIRMHMVNHPSTRHYCQSVWDVDPLEVCLNYARDRDFRSADRIKKG